MSNKKYSPVAASISVPPAEREEFEKSKAAILEAATKSTGSWVSFSALVRMLVNGTVEDGKIIVSLE